MATLGSTTTSQSRPDRIAAASVLYDRKLDRALRNTFDYNYQQRKANGKASMADMGLSNWWCHEDVREEDLIKNETHWAYILRNIIAKKLTAPTDFLKKVAPIYDKSLESIFEAIWLQFGALYRDSTCEHLINIKADLRNIKDATTNDTIMSTLLYIHYSINNYLKDLSEIDSMRKEEKHNQRGFMTDHYEKKRLLVLFHGRVKIYCTPDLCSLIIDGIGTYLAPRDVILLIHNKASDCLSVLWATQANCGTQYEKRSYDLALEWITECANIICRYKTKGFSILKVLEGIVVGETLVDIEGRGNSTFLRAIIEDLVDSTSFDYTGSDLRMVLKECSIPFRHELACLSKLVGHPYVDMEQGCRDLYKKTHEVYDLNIHHIALVTCYVKENFVRNYRLRKNEWPPVDTSMLGDHHPLTQSARLNRDPSDEFIVRTYGVTPIEDYSMLELLPCMEFNKLENVIPYLKDKTISMLRSDVMNTYINHQASTTHPRSNWKETRLLLAYMLTPTSAHDHVKYIEKYADVKDLDLLDDYLVIRVVPKEKEMKVSFRGFGCKTFEDRMRALAQEKTVMEFLSLYSDDQAMTISELQLAKKINAFRRMTHAYAGHTLLYVVIDAQSWNNHFRPETVEPVMRETLDKIYDTTIFSKTHEAYQKTLYYVPDSSGCFWWEGQSGGIEGLNQDSWVVIYIGQIKAALREVEYPYHILCKGDDLRIVFALPPVALRRRTMEEIRVDLVTRLSKFLQKVGHVIKIDESYGSCSYFAFSKQASIGMIEMPQTLRKIQKCYGATNALMPTLDEYIGSTFSNAHSAAKVSVGVLSCYITALRWACIYILDDKRYSDLSVDELTALLLVPGLVGGFPIIYLHNFPVRAESDLLPPFLSILSFAKTQPTQVASIMENFLYLPDSDQEDRKALFLDPYCLPTSRPVMPTTYLRKICRRSIKKLTKNQHLSELLKAADSLEMREFLECLCTAQPFSAKILSAVYAASPEGIINELIRKFESARSIMEVVIMAMGRARAERLLSKCIIYEDKVQLWRRQKLLGGGNLTRPDVCDCTIYRRDCPAEYAQIIRDRMWKTPITSITMPPLQHLVSYHDEDTMRYNEWASQNHFRYTLHPPVESAGLDDIGSFTAGDAAPFLGHTTRTGTIAPTIDIPVKDGLIVKLKNLIDLAAWTSPTIMLPDGTVARSNLPAAIDMILRMYTEYTLDQLDPITAKQRGTGTAQHHVRAPCFRESIVPNTLVNMYTRSVGESDTHLGIKTSDHFLINFLHVYCHSIWTLCLENESFRSLPGRRCIWGVTTSCQFCRTPIVEPPIRLDLSMIQSMPAYTLSSLTIAERAINQFKESAKEFVGSGVTAQYHAESLSFVEASYGILQEIVDLTYNRKVDLGLKYGSHSLTSAAYSVLSAVSSLASSRDIGLSELRRIPVKIIVEYLISVMPYLLRRLCPYPSRNTLLTIIETHEATNLPWYEFIFQLSKIGVLPILIAEISRRTRQRPPICHHSAAGSTKYIGVAFTISGLRSSVRCPMIWLSNYNPHISKPHLSALLTRYIYHDLRTVFIPSAKTAYTLEKNWELRTPLLMYHVLIMVSYLIKTVDIMSDLAAQIVMDDHVRALTCKDFIRYDFDDIVEWLSTEEGYQEMTWPLGRCGFRITDLPSSDDTLMLLDPFLMEETENVVRRNFDSTGLRVVYTSMSDCTTTIRSQRDPLDPLLTMDILDTVDEEDEDEEDEYPPLERRVSKYDQALDQALIGAPAARASYARVVRGLDARLRLNDPSNHHANYCESVIMRDIYTKSKSLRSILYTQTFNPPDIIELDPTYDWWYLNYGGACRLDGTVTGSEGMMREIMFALGLKPCPSVIYNVLALSDGEGGLTSTFLAYFPRSRVLFHTYRETVVVDHLPQLVHVYFPQLTNQIDTSLLEEGLYKLNIPATWDKITQKPDHYQFLLCDIELNPLKVKDDYMITVYKNIIKYGSSVLTYNGTCIIRVSTRRLNAFAEIINYAHQCFRYTTCFRPMSMKEGCYTYLVAWGRAEINIENLRGPYSAEANRLARSVKKQIDIRYQRITTDLRAVMNLSAAVSPAMMTLPPYPIYDRGVNIMNTRLFVQISGEVVGPLSLLGIENMDTWRKELYKRILPYLRLQDHRRIFMRAKSSMPDVALADHHDTLTHSAIALGNYTYVQGICDILGRTINDAELSVSRYECHQWYEQFWLGLPETHRLADKYIHHFWCYYKHYDVPCSVGKTYLKGVEHGATIRLCAEREARLSRKEPNKSNE